MRTLGQVFHDLDAAAIQALRRMAQDGISVHERALWLRNLETEALSLGDNVAALENLRAHVDEQGG